MEYVNLNGRLLKTEDSAPGYDNRAFRYGYGLFETMLLKNGIIQLKDYHWQRLFAGIQQLGLEIPALYTQDRMEDQALKTAEKNGVGDICRIRLQVFAGSGGLFDPKNQRLDYIIECFPIEEHISLLNETGLHLGIATGLAKSADSLASLKSCNALLYVMAARQAKDNKWNDALVKNTAGNIIESTIANLFLIKDNVIYTPALAEGCVAGVMRRHIIDTLAKENIQVLEKAITEQELYDADEVFLSNAIKRIKWVARLGDKTYANKYTKHIYTLLFDKE